MTAGITGLSGSETATLAFNLKQILFDIDYQAYVLDGDSFKFGLSFDLGFSQKDRTENIRRTSKTTSLFARANFYSPF
jgi:adenylylsulfate kinase